MRAGIGWHFLAKGLSMPKTKTPPAPALPAGKRKQRSTEELMQRIVQAATDEFKRAGYAGATTAAIARKAEVTEAQLFRYFPSKSELFKETVFNPLDAQLLAFTNTHLTDGGAIAHYPDMVALYTNELQRFIGDNVELITSLVAAETYEAEAGHGVGAISSLGKYFDRAAAIMQRRIKGKPAFDPKLMVRVTFTAVLACVMFKKWIFPAGLASEDEIRRVIDGFVLEGISANAYREEKTP
jgi:AcrR family transcriptional regulator